MSRKLFFGALYLILFSLEKRLRAAFLNLALEFRAGEQGDYRKNYYSITLVRWAIT